MDKREDARFTCKKPSKFDFVEQYPTNNRNPLGSEDD